MDRLAYTVLSGMRSAMAAQDVTANNIANAATIGFRRDIGSTQSRPVAGGSFASRIQVAEQVLAADMSAGTLTSTGRPLDVAVTGTAMIAVQAPDGIEAYTRRGDLRVSATGVLENGEGRIVIGENGPITVPPAARIDIGANGTVNIQPEGGAPNEMVEIGRIKLASPDIAALRKHADGLFRTVDGTPVSRDEQARVETGTIENSNVNSMAAMIDLLDHARAYEVQVKLLNTTRDLDQSSTSLLRLDS